MAQPEKWPYVVRSLVVGVVDEVCDVGPALTFVDS